MAIDPKKLPEYPFMEMYILGEIGEVTPSVEERAVGPDDGAAGGVEGPANEQRPHQARPRGGRLRSPPRWLT
jgi:hypothetical protein